MRCISMLLTHVGKCYLCTGELTCNCLLEQDRAFSLRTLWHGRTHLLCIWMEAWTLLSGPERVQLYKKVSLPFPEFADDMLDVAYAASCCGPLDTMD